MPFARRVAKGGQRICFRLNATQQLHNVIANNCRRNFFYDPERHPRSDEPSGYHDKNYILSGKNSSLPPEPMPVRV
jgi:hypothetical protein